MASILNATTSTGFTVSPDNSGSLQLATNNGTTAVTIDTSQNVGIGTSSPDSSNKLQVSGNIGLSWAANKFIGMKFDSGSSYKMGLMLNDTTRECKVWSQSSDSDDKITFYTGSTPSERMRITSAGSILLGTTTAEGATGISFSNASDSAAYGKSMYMNSPYNGTRNAISFAYNSSGVGAIVTGTSSTSYNTSSDYRLKENIAPMTGALDKVALLKPVTYKWKLDGSNGQGFIAHELQAVVPNCVTGEKDAVETYIDENGNEQTRPVYQGVDTSFLVATLTAAIQELNAKVEAQAVRIAELEGAK